MQRYIFLFLIIHLACSKTNEIPDLMAGETNENGYYVEFETPLEANMQSIACKTNKGQIDLDITNDEINDITFMLFEKIPDVSQVCCVGPDTIIFDCYPSANISKSMEINTNNIFVACSEELPLMLNRDDKLHTIKNWCKGTDLLLHKISGVLGSDMSYKGNWLKTTDNYLGLKIDEGSRVRYAWIKIETDDSFWQNNFSVISYFVQQ